MKSLAWDILIFLLVVICAFLFGIFLGTGSTQQAAVDNGAAYWSQGHVFHWKGEGTK